MIFLYKLSILIVFYMKNEIDGKIIAKDKNKLNDILDEYNGINYSKKPEKLLESTEFEYNNKNMKDKDNNEKIDFKFVTYKNLENLTNSDKNSLLQDKLEININKNDKNHIKENFYNEEDWILFIKEKKEPSFSNILKDLKIGLNPKV